MSTPPDNIKCSRGHLFAAAEDGIRTAAVVCPVCGESVQSDALTEDQEAKGRSLWSVMQSGGDAGNGGGRTGGSTEDGTAATPDADQTPRSRWSVVESDQDDSPHDQSESFPDSDSPDPCGEGMEAPVEATASEKPDSDDRSVPDRPRGLWAMMEEATADVAAEPDVQGDDRTDGQPRLSSVSADGECERLDGISDSDEFEMDESGDHILARDDNEEDTWQLDEDDEYDPASVAVATFRQAPVSGPVSDRQATHSDGRTAVLALSCGVAAVFSAGFNLLPGFWGKIPATAFGLGALFWSYQSFHAGRRGPESSTSRIKAGVGLICGLIGMFAGPMLLNSLGNDWREEKLRLAITQNLELIGEGVEKYYNRHSVFPHADYSVEDGVEVPMHSWLSALLPHTGYSELARMIVRQEPYNAPVNFRAMSTTVPLFLVPNVEHQPTLRGLATAHFAGVGGDMLTTAGQVDVGAFSRGRNIDREMLIDGASQTMLAGEITRLIPAWGEPGNWRTIGRGLNQQVSGFGNASGTGAHFLMADGSVRLFPNATSRDVLVKLSTRNGDDPVCLP